MSALDLRNSPKCQVCLRPMLAGQRERHYVCSPPAECCGWPVDLLPDDHHHDLAEMSA